MSETVQLFADAWKVMVGRLPSPHIEETDGVVSCFGNVPLIFLNISIVTRPAATGHELRGLLATAAGHRAACEHPTGVLLREDWLPPGWEDVIKDAGLAAVLPMTGMEGNELLPPRRVQTGLEVRRVADTVTARDLAEVNAHAYHMPPEGFECIANMRLWHPDSCGYVGYADGVPVSAAAAFPVAGTVYVALVATLPTAQGKGYAETVMREAVTHGQQAMGTTRTTLHATDMGMPVYRAMGYRPGARLIFAAPA
jgi:GNAT superfamily N-acetyltransferase